MIQLNRQNDAIGTANRANPGRIGTLHALPCRLQGEVRDVAGQHGRAATALSARFRHGHRRAAPTPPTWASTTTRCGCKGFLYGANGLPAGLSNNPDDCVFPNVSVETEFGTKVKTKARVPLMTGALGSTFIAAKYWESFAVGAALVGFPIVVGENVVGVDRQSVIENGRIEKSPELDRRIDTFLRYYDGYGAVIVQLNVEDTRNGVAEYVVDKYGDKVMIELKWGQGAKDIGGEIQVTTYEYAMFLKERGYVVDPGSHGARREGSVRTQCDSCLRPPQSTWLYRPGLRWKRCRRTS